MVGSPVVGPEYRQNDRLMGGFFMPEAFVWMAGGLAHHVLDHAFLLHQLTLAGIDSRRQREVAARLAFGEIELLDRLTIIADQREVLGAGLMQTNDVAREATGFGDLIPHVRIIRAGFEQAVEGFLRVGGAILSPPRWRPLR